MRSTRPHLHETLRPKSFSLTLMRQLQPGHWTRYIKRRPWNYVTKYETQSQYTSLANENKTFCCSTGKCGNPLIMS